LASPSDDSEVCYFSYAEIDGEVLLVIYRVFNTRTCEHYFKCETFVGVAVDIELARNSDAANFLTMKIEAMLGGDDAPAEYNPTFFVADLPKSKP
jgi:hypothetical protein